MNTIKQIIAVTLLNLRNLPKRLGSSVVAVVGVGAVVLVFAAVLSMAAGLEKTIIRTLVDTKQIFYRRLVILDIEGLELVLEHAIRAFRSIIEFSNQILPQSII